VDRKNRVRTKRTHPTDLARASSRNNREKDDPTTRTVVHVDRHERTARVAVSVDHEARDPRDLKAISNHDHRVVLVLRASRPVVPERKAAMTRREPATEEGTVAPTRVRVNAVDLALDDGPMIPRMRASSIDTRLRTRPESRRLTKRMALEKETGVRLTTTWRRSRIWMRRPVSQVTGRLKWTRVKRKERPRLLRVRLARIRARRHRV